MVDGGIFVFLDSQVFESLSFWSIRFYVDAIGFIGKSKEYIGNHRTLIGKSQKDTGNYITNLIFLGFVCTLSLIINSLQIEICYSYYGIVININ